MADQADTEPVERPPNGGPPGEDWQQRDGRGRLYVRHNGRAVFRRGEETVAEAIARDDADQAQPKRDKRPRAKGKKPRMPPAPKHVDLKELEKMLAEALTAPAAACAMFGDEWAANHFTNQGPYLARNLILASEHNPWLRRKLEEMATGQDAAMKLISALGVGAALFGYAAPPLVYWLNLPVPDKARLMFNIPPAREHAPAATPPIDDPAAAVAA